VVQGAFGGGLLATAQSILRDTFPPKQLGLSQGIFALGAVMGPALGPPLGGLLVDNASWNWCFDINIGPGIASALLMIFLLKDPESAHAMRVDFVGLALLAVGLGSLQYVLTEGEPNYWFADPIVLAMSLVCVAALAAFAFWELYGTNTPVVDLRALKNRSISAGSVLSFALGAVLLGSTYTLPQLTQGVLGFTPTLSGELFIIRAVPILLLTFVIVRVATKVDTRILVGMGFITLAVANAMQGFVTTSQATFLDVRSGARALGRGLAILFIPLTIAVLAGTTPAEGPKASAFLNFRCNSAARSAVAGLERVHRSARDVPQHAAGRRKLRWTTGGHAVPRPPAAPSTSCRGSCSAVDHALVRGCDVLGRDRCRAVHSARAAVAQAEGRGGAPAHVEMGG
jgi:DHA2 family multidrug resistance protein